MECQGYAMSKPFSGADFKPHRTACPSCKSVYLMDAPWKRVRLACYLRTKGKTTPTARIVAPAEQIEPGMLRRLIQLCHPDRHGNSETANIATRYLLALKGALHG